MHSGSKEVIIWDKILPFPALLQSNHYVLFPSKTKWALTKVPENKFFPALFSWVLWMRVSRAGQQQSEIYSLGSLRDSEMAKYMGLKWIFGPATSTSPRTYLTNYISNFLLQTYWIKNCFLRRSQVIGGFSGSSAGKESTYNAGDPSSVPLSGRSSGEGIGYPL